MPGRVQLGLNDLDVMISDDKDPSREVRLKIWNGVTIRRWSERVFAGRIVEAQVHETLRASDSIGVLMVSVISGLYIL
jgi:hypothetical protein